MTADYDRAVRDHRIDVLEADGELLALIEMIPAADLLWIQNIAVGESRQGSGLGRLLLDHAEEIARQSGLREIKLNTNAAFAANLSFYLHMGFLEVSREPLPDGGTMVFFTKPVS